MKMAKKYNRTKVHKLFLWPSTEAGVKYKRYKYITMQKYLLRSERFFIFFLMIRLNWWICRSSRRMVIVPIDKKSAKSIGRFFSAETFSKNELTFSIFTIFFEKYFIRTNVNPDLYFWCCVQPPTAWSLAKKRWVEQNSLFLDVVWLSPHQILGCDASF